MIWYSCSSWPDVHEDLRAGPCKVPMQHRNAIPCDDNHDNNNRKNNKNKCDDDDNNDAIPCIMCNAAA